MAEHEDSGLSRVPGIHWGFQNTRTNERLNCTVNVFPLPQGLWDDFRHSPHQDLPLQRDTALQRTAGGSQNDREGGIHYLWGGVLPIKLRGGVPEVGGKGCQWTQLELGVLEMKRSFTLRQLPVRKGVEESVTGTEAACSCSVICP